jgi:heme/copper-type cytochrome/quinol oxidase subunit 3
LEHESTCLEDPAIQLFNFAGHTEYWLPGQSEQIVIRRNSASQNLMNRDNSSQPGKRLGFAAYLLAGIPFFAVSFGVFFANRDEPVLFGFPFLLSYLIFWICATPLFLWLADRSARQ